MEIVSLTEDNFSSFLAEGGMALVEFYATFCGPCKSFAPTLQAFAEDTPAIRVGKMDVERSDKWSTAYEVSSVPTLLLFQDGKLVDRHTGQMDLPALRQFVTGR